MSSNNSEVSFSRENNSSPEKRKGLQKIGVIAGFLLLATACTSARKEMDDLLAKAERGREPKPGDKQVQNDPDAARRESAYADMKQKQKSEDSVSGNKESEDDEWERIIEAQDPEIARLKEIIALEEEKARQELKLRQLCEFARRKYKEIAKRREEARKERNRKREKNRMKALKRK